MEAGYFIGLFRDNLQQALPKYKTIDGSIERLNRRTLATIFVILSVLSIEDGLLGNRITCVGFKIFKNSEFVKDYCWTQGIFTNRYAYDRPPDSMPAPGIIPCIRAVDGYKCSLAEQRKQIVFHLWYQWVPMFFIISAFAFYIPYIITRSSIVGKLSVFVDTLQDPADLVGSNGSAERLGKLLFKWIDHNLNQRYKASPFDQFLVPFIQILTKVAYLGVSIGHFYVTGMMFPIGNYYQLGITWHIPESENYTHVGDVLFPKMAGCLVQKYTATGLSQESGMCNLAPNVVFQYLFLITWWCVAILIVLNAISLLKGTGELFIHHFIYKIFKHDLDVSYDKSNGENGAQYKGPTKDDTRIIFAYYDLSSHIVFHLISDNVHPAILSLGLRYTADRIREEMGADEGLREFVLQKMTEHGHNGESSGGSAEEAIQEEEPSGSRGPRMGKNFFKRGYKAIKDRSTQL